MNHSLAREVADSFWEQLFIYYKVNTEEALEVVEILKNDLLTEKSKEVCKSECT